MTTPGPTARDTRTLSLVAALVAAGLVPPERRDDAVVVVDRVLAGQSTDAAPLKRRLAELAGYVGGAFVVSAAAIFLVAQWDHLTALQHVGLLGGIAVVLTVAGLALGAWAGGLTVVRRGGAPVRRRLVGALLTGAACSAAGAAGVLVDEAMTHPDTGPGFAAFATLAVLSLLGYLVAPTVVGQLGVAAGAVGSVALVVERFHGPSLVAGLGVLAVAVVWLVVTERGAWREVASARVVGSVLAVAGGQVAAFGSEDLRWAGYLTLALVAAAGFTVYVARPAWPYLAAGVVAVTLVVPEALLDWTGDSLGPAGGLLAAGVTLLVASLLGFRLRREVAEG